MTPVSADALPPYTYVPGRAPHPLREPDGHSYGEAEEPVDAPVVDRPDDSPRFLRGTRLFDAGFYWEAHEAWESLWLAAGRTSPLAAFLKGLIKLAAAGVKVREGVPSGVKRHARRAAELFEEAAEAFDGSPVLGLDPRELAARAEQIAQSPPTCEHADSAPRVVFDFTLQQR